MAPDLRPSRYRVHISPDLSRGDYRGEVVVDVEMKRRRAEIELHAVDLAVEHAEVGAGRRTIGAAAEIQPKRDTVLLRLDEAVGPGKARLRLQFSGKLQTTLRGFYAASSGQRRYGFTQLEAADARRFFPCFDEPSFKARFTFAVTTETRNSVVSNSPIDRVEEHGGGSKTVHFAPTPKLSTYLCALAVGELESSEERRVGRTPIRVWHVPGKGSLCAFALEAAVESLSRLERYFGLAYPYAKLDLVAVPDFEAGAMENAGAVFFRETLLLVDPETITLGEKKRVAEVIAHELAHMWYGDLVTMAWWNDLWLNEAFATWMAFRVIDDWKPEWRMWNNFDHHRAAALSLDALSNTHPIYAEVQCPAEATENFDAITYEKGASVVRMVENYLGPKAFRSGVRKYIREHREANAEAADLWRALEKASGQKVNGVVRAWIEQPGFPLVESNRQERNGRSSLQLRQQRFFAKPKTSDTGQRWPVPLVIKVGGRKSPRLVRYLMTKARDRIDLGSARSVSWYYANASEGGFYRPLHDREDLSVLTASLPDLLAAVERMGLVGHQWAALRSGHASVESFLDLASGLGGETDFDVLTTLAGPLRFIDDHLVDDAGPDARPLFRSWLSSMFRKAWRELGWDPGPGESDDTRLRRASILRLLGEVAQDPAAAAESQARFSRYLDDRGSLEPNLTDSVVAIVAREGDAQVYERFLDAAKAAKTPQERRRFELALADFCAPQLVARTHSLMLTDTIATQDVGIVMVRMFANPRARESTWKFVKDRWEVLSKRLPPMMMSRVVDATPSLKTKAYKRDVAAFFRAHPVPTAKRALRQALERFDLNEEFRRRAAKGLRRWLESRRH